VKSAVKYHTSRNTRV